MASSWFAIDGLGTPTLHAGRGTERLSHAWRFDLTITAPEALELERTALGRRASLSIEQGGTPRVLHGVVSRVALEESLAHHQASSERSCRYRVHLEPRLALLRKTVRTRIFQAASVVDIACQVLGQHGIAAERRLVRQHPVRTYCTQYEESDYQFVRRILGEAGIGFYFHAGAPTPDPTPRLAGDSVVLIDDANAYQDIGFVLRNVMSLDAPDGDHRTAEHVHVVNQTLPTRAIFRDYDPARPLLRLEGYAASTAPFHESPADVEAHRFARAMSGGVAVPTPGPIAGAQVSPTSADAWFKGTPEAPLVYEHHNPYLFPSWEAARAEAGVVLRARRRRASVLRGESPCHELSVGHRFDLREHPVASVDGSYAVIRVDHAWTADGGRHRTTFEAVPAEVFYPPKRAPRVSVQVSHTATVVGPPGEEIFTDEQGRIKVQFHWDRDGRHDDQSSCWLRPMQAWAGAGWGHQFLPRVGMEVVVLFDGGDPDKPMVLGALANGANATPFATPGERTRSGIRTRSTPRGEGFNELSFEDRAGQEEVFVRAQRALRERVGTDRDTEVGNDVTELVGRNRTVRVGATLQEEVRGDRHTFTKGSTFHVAKGDVTTGIRGRFGLAIQGAASVEVGTTEKPQSAELFVTGDATVGATRTIRFRADELIELVCGSSMIQIGPERVTILTKELVVDAKDRVEIGTPESFVRLADKAEVGSAEVRLMSSKASLALDDDAWLDGQKVNLNCRGVRPGGRGREALARLKKLSLVVSDERMVKLAGKDYVLTSGGARFEGKTDAEGRIEVEVPAHARTAAVTVFYGSRPLGRTLELRIRLEPLPPFDTIRGVKARLENLGYYWGAIDDELEPIASAALAEFQADFGIERTGAPDDTTITKLEQVANLKSAHARPLA